MADWVEGYYDRLEYLMSGGAFIREKVRQESFARSILTVTKEKTTSHPAPPHVRRRPRHG